MTAKRQDWLERCLKRTDEVLAIIKDWLTLSRVESGALSKEKQKVDLKPVILGIMETYEEMATEHDVILKSELPDNSIAGDSG